eukprot:2508274-Rhodomonas_salina.3
MIIIHTHTTPPPPPSSSTHARTHTDLLLGDLLGLRLLLLVLVRVPRLVARHARVPRPRRRPRPLLRPPVHVHALPPILARLHVHLVGPPLPRPPARLRY